MAATQELKKQISYTYWKRETDVNRTPAPAPQKIDPTPSLQPTNSSPSAWNASGTTFEHKDVTAKFIANLGSILSEYFATQVTCPQLDISEVEVNDEGRTSASICIVRSRPRLGYEVGFKITFKNGAQVAVEDFVDYDDSFQLKVVKFEKNLPSSLDVLREHLIEFKKKLPQLFVGTS